MLIPKPWIQPVRTICPKITFCRFYHPTIFALSTRPGRAAIGVIRVLGPKAQYVYHQLTKSKKPPLPQRTSVRRIFGSNGMLDEALTVFFRGPKTYTGEDLLELHVHGGNAIIKAVLGAIQELHDPENGTEIRMAQQGEFSRRAFMSGRLDLTEIEGIREMIDADTESQRLSALASLTGENKQVFARWREEIVRNMALLTTVIDFGEEHDLEETKELFSTVEKSIDSLIAEIEKYLRKVRGSDILLRGIKVCLLGPPNAGKLSLLNYLANNNTAIVSHIAGTTRDILDVPLDIGGFKVVVGDSAGIRSLEKADTIEQEGIRRAKQRSLVGDVVVAVLPVNEPLSPDLKEHMDLLRKEQKPTVVVLNKADLVEKVDKTAFTQALQVKPENVHVVSCLNGQGMDSLREALVAHFKVASMSETSDPVVISARAQDLLEHDVLYGLKQFKVWKDSEDVVLAEECLRQSVEGIGKITGEAVGVEEILGVVFSSFCIGK